MEVRGRRSLRYIRLAAYLAAQPPDVDEVVLTLSEIGEVVGESLPANSRFPSWWKNDDRRMHSRAWLTAGWEVRELRVDDPSVVFIRRKPARS